MSITIEHVLEKVSDSIEYFKELNVRKNRDLEIYSGNFWTEDTIKQFDRVGRICQTFSQYPKFVNSIISPLTKSPYHLEIDDPKLDIETKKELQEKIDKIENESKFKYKCLNSSKNAAILGTGFLVVSFHDNEIIPELVRDINSVILDPTVKEITAEDAEYGAIINYIPISKAKREYGDEIVDYNNNSRLNVLDTVLPKDSCMTVSFYEKNDKGTVDFAYIVGNKIVNEEELPISRIPIIRFAMNEVIRNKKIDYVGIVDLTKDLMISQNIAFSTLMERANRTPKASYMMEVSQLDGLDEYYKKLQTKDSLVCLYNGNKVATPPGRIQESFETTDLQNTISETSNLMAQVIGVPIGGVNPAMNSVTATEILVQQNNSESNVESLYLNVESAIRDLSSIILESLCYLNKLEVPNFKLVNGPNVITQTMKRRQELSVISNLLTDDVSKKIIAKSYIETLDNDVSEKLVRDLIANSKDVTYMSEEETGDPNAVATLNKMQDLLEQTQNQLETVTNMNIELQNTNRQLELSLTNQKQQNELELLKIQQNYELENKKLDLDAAKSNVDIKSQNTKQAIENVKLQKEIVSLEKEKLNAIQ